MRIIVGAEYQETATGSFDGRDLKNIWAAVDDSAVPSSYPHGLRKDLDADLAPGDLLHVVVATYGHRHNKAWLEARVLDVFTNIDAAAALAEVTLRPPRRWGFPVDSPLDRYPWGRRWKRMPLHGVSVWTVRLSEPAPRALARQAGVRFYKAG